MQTQPDASPSKRFSIEGLEPRVLPSVTPISFDPNGTLIRGIGTVMGVKFISVSGGGGPGSVFGVPTGGGHNAPVVRVFATDLNTDGIVEANEITGVALSQKADVTIFGSVNGDIVTNLIGGGLSGAGSDGSVLLADSISRLTVHGSVAGNIVAGRNMNQIHVDGSVGEIVSGTAANGLSVHFHGPDGGAVALESFTMAHNQNAGSISNVYAGTGLTGILAGDGGVGGSGGRVSDVRVISDASALTIQAGNGVGDVNGTGGNGGAVLNITVNSCAGATVIAGDGGDTSKPTTLGGQGGMILNVRLNATGAVIMSGGDGGSDAHTGTGSRGNNGGDVRTVIVNGTDIMLTAGSGGDGGATGGRGGSVLSVRGSLGGEGDVIAGHGGSSSGSGGAGGQVGGINFAVGTEAAFLRAVVAGDGGAGDLRNGMGGSIQSLRFAGDIGDFQAAYGVDSMGGLFAGTAGGSLFGKAAFSGNVGGITATRIAAIVAGTADAPSPAQSISGIHAQVIGANFDATVQDGVEPGFSYFESSVPSNDQYNLGEIPIDGPVIAAKIGSLSVKPLFEFQTSPPRETGALDPQPAVI